MSGCAATIATAAVAAAAGSSSLPYIPAVSAGPRCPLGAWPWVARRNTSGTCRLARPSMARHYGTPPPLAPAPAIAPMPRSAAVTPSAVASSAAASSIDVLVTPTVRWPYGAFGLMPASVSSQRRRPEPSLRGGLNPVCFFREGDGGTEPAPGDGAASGMRAAEAAATGTESAAAEAASGQPLRPPGPQSNAVPFVATTRHHRHVVVHSYGTTAEDDRDGGVDKQRQSIGSGSGDQRHGQPHPHPHTRPHREQLYEEAELQAVNVHPNLLEDDLAAEATVPYDSAGGLDTGSGFSSGLMAAAMADAGTAAGRPSGGAGPHGGLNIEDVDPVSGGYTISMPVMDPTYDDVGRAIRQEQGVRHHQPPSRRVLAAEVWARKAATAEDLREALLEEAPELQDVYGAFGGGGELGLEAARRDLASGYEVEALVESCSLGLDGAVLTEAAEVGLSLEDPLLTAPSPYGGAGGGGSGGDPLAFLDAFVHQEVLERLEARAAAARGADIADVMPRPPHLETAATITTAPPRVADADAASRRSGGGSLKEGRLIATQRRLRRVRKGAAAVGGGAGASTAFGDGCSVPKLRLYDRHRTSSRSAGRIARGGGAGPTTASVHPPFYHTSPDVPDEDLEVQSARQQRWRQASPLSSSSAPPLDLGPSGAAQGPRRGGSGGDETFGRQHTRSAACTVYGNSPDVLDSDLDRDGYGLASGAAATVDMNAQPATNGSGSCSAMSVRQSAAVPAPVAAPACPSAGSPRPSVISITTAAEPSAAVPPPRPSDSGDSRRLKSLGDVDRQFIDLDTASGWDEQAHNLRSAMRGTTPRLGRLSSQQQQKLPSQPPGARGAHSSLQPQTIGIHGSMAAGGAATSGSGGGAAAAVGAHGNDGHAVRVLRVESVPSQTYGAARTAAVLAADGKLTLLARPTGPSPDRVRAAIRLLRMAPGSRDFEVSASAAVAAAADDDERAAAEAEAAVAAAVAAAVGTSGMERETQHRLSLALKSVPPSSVDEQALVERQPGLVLGMTEINPDEVPADPQFPLESLWGERHDHHDPHDPHGTEPMALDVEGHMMGMQANMWQEDYDEVMGQIVDSQRSGWSEDGVNSAAVDGYASDVY